MAEQRKRKLCVLYIDGHAATCLAVVFEHVGVGVRGTKRLTKLNIVILLLNFPTVSAMSFLTAMCSDII